MELTLEDLTLLHELVVKEWSRALLAGRDDVVVTLKRIEVKIIRAGHELKTT